MNISFLDSIDGECDYFVQNIAGAKLCHMPAWTRMIEDTFSYKGYYLVARENRRVCGVLPLMHIRSRLFGNRLVSQPFSDYGGALAASPVVLEALYNHAVEIAVQSRCDSMELRNTVPLVHELHLRTDKVSMYLPLSRDPQDVWKDLRHKTRNRIRKAEGIGFTVKVGGQEFLDEFYRVWTVRMRELGTPCYPRKLFSSILETFPSDVQIFLAALNGVTTAVLFAYTFNGWVQCSWGAALRDYDNMGPNYVLNWEAIKYYCEKGMKWFDFGRSTIGSGQYTFKERWGANRIDLCWQYWTPPGQSLVIANPNDQKYRKRVEMWKRMPLWMSRLIGPMISRSLG